MFYNFNLMPVFRIMECIQVLVLEKTCLEYSVLGLVPDVVDDSLHNPTNYAEYQLDLAQHNNLSLHISIGCDDVLFHYVGSIKGGPHSNRLDGN